MVSSSVSVQKGLLDNQNPGFCMGWPGLYLLDNIDQLGSVWHVRVELLHREIPVKNLYFPLFTDCGGIL